MAKTKRNKPQEDQHYEAPRKKKTAPPKKLQPPLVPMIDVTFQLLLYFLLTAQFRLAEGQIAGTIPHGDVGSATPVEIRPIQITIRRGGEGLSAVYEISPPGVVAHRAEDLYQHLSGQKARVGDQAEVRIAPDSDVAWQFVTEAYNQAIRLKFHKVGFAPGN